MKEISIKKYNFRQLIEKLTEEKSIFSLPDYQREYSWSRRNWEMFLETAKELIEKKENNQIWFIGSITLQRQRGNGVSFYDIIDGQQRLITIFILISVIYDKGDYWKENALPIEQEIKKLMFLDSENRQLRMKLNDSDDQEEFENVINSNFFYLREESDKIKGKGNISFANRWFHKHLSKRGCSDIYGMVLEKFYFSLNVIDEEADPAEIFMTLNTVGEGLTNSDLIRSLFISQSSPETRSKIKEIWKEEIERKVCLSSFKKQPKSQKMEIFLICFWEAHSSQCRWKTWDIKLYSFYRLEVKKNNLEQNSNFLKKIVEAADVYNKIIFSTDPFSRVLYYEKHKQWWEKNWSLKMFYLIHDLYSLECQEFFSLILAVYFQFREKSREDKKEIVNDLQKLVTYIFRRVIIKKMPSETVFLRKIRTLLLEKINRGAVSLFKGETQWKEQFKEEFEDRSSEEFYQQLAKYENQDKSNKGIWEFIFRNYYQKKLLGKEDISEGQTAELRTSINLYMVPLSKKQKHLNTWANFSLSKTNSVNDLDDKNCLMNILENRYESKIDEIDDLIEERKKWLLKDFKKLRIFEVD